MRSLACPCRSLLLRDHHLREVLVVRIARASTKQHCNGDAGGVGIANIRSNYPVVRPPNHPSSSVFSRASVDHRLEMCRSICFGARLVRFLIGARGPAYPVRRQLCRSSRLAGPAGSATSPGPGPEDRLSSQCGCGRRARAQEGFRSVTIVPCDVWKRAGVISPAWPA